MARVRLLPKAATDLADIWRHTVEKWGVQQAITYTEAINTAFEQLSETPFIYRERPEFSPPVRIAPHASHLIVYLVDNDGTIVVRVLHQNMDVDSRLEED